MVTFSGILIGALIILVIAWVVFRDAISEFKK